MSRSSVLSLSSPDRENRKGAGSNAEAVGPRSSEGMLVDAGRAEGVCSALKYISAAAGLEREVTNIRSVRLNKPGVAQNRSQASGNELTITTKHDRVLVLHLLSTVSLL